MKFKTVAVLLTLAAAAALMIWIEPFYKSCNEISDNALRLHIVANSDGEGDQAVKLAVRDAVLAVSADRIRASDGKQSATESMAASLDEIEQAADLVLAKAGYSYTSKAYLCEMHFDTLTYGGATLPSGRYTALRIELGGAQGKNWWCVMYPPLCVMASSESEDSLLSEAFSEDQVDIILGGEKYAVKFKLVELWEQFTELFK